MKDLTLTLLMALGALIAGLGLGMDFLLPGASPGFNLPQLSIVLLGALLAGFAALIKRGWRPKTRARARGRQVAAIAIVCALTLLILELALAAAGLATYFPSDLVIREVRLAPWWVCDAHGCRFVKEEAIRACQSGDLIGRRCLVNAQGYPDSEDFVLPLDAKERSRILVLGDSFAQGFAADIGKSFAETLEALLPESIVWNAGISGTGTSQAVASFRQFAPQLKPHLTVLSFYMNDFRDNLIPLNGWMQLQDGAGNLQFIRASYIDRWGNEVAWPPDVLFAYASRNYLPPLNDMERLIGLTRLGSVGLRALDQLSNAYGQNSFAEQEAQTGRYLAELRDLALEHNSGLLVLVIPRGKNIGSPSQHYYSAGNLMAELGIPHMRLEPLLVWAEDYAKPPDEHWNNRGHQRIGAMLADCALRIEAGSELADCPHVTVQ